MKYKRTITIYSNEPIESCVLPYKYYKIEDSRKEETQQESALCNLKKQGKKIIIYQRVEWKIGGIETWGYNLAKSFKDKDITFVFQSADKEQVQRLSKYANVIMDDGKMEFDCDIFISANYDGSSEILERVKAKKYYQTIHSDFSELVKLPEWRNFKLEINPKYEIIAASETAQKGLKKLGYESRVARNPLAEMDERPLVLLSMTRVSVEKGAKRMLKLAQELKKAEVNFIWILASTLEHTDEPEIIEQIKAIPEFIIIPPSVRNEPLYYLADMCVQLSDTEAYCYTIRQSLMAKTPVLATRFEQAKQIIKEGGNGYLVDFDMKDLNIAKITGEIPVMKERYEEKIDSAWEEILSGE